MMFQTFCFLADAAAKPDEGINWAGTLFLGGGNIGFVLWGISITMMAVLIQNIMATRRQNFAPPGLAEQLREMIEAKKYSEAISLVSSNTDVLSQMIRAAIGEAKYGFASMERAMDEAIEATTSKMYRATEMLNLLGNVGPMVGLLGTVWGLIKTFFVLAAAGGSPDTGKLAQAIGIKLVCTLLGLCVAIPSLTAYGMLRNRIESLTAEAAVTGEGLISYFRRGKKEE